MNQRIGYYSSVLSFHFKVNIWLKCYWKWSHELCFLFFSFILFQMNGLSIFVSVEIEFLLLLALHFDWKRKSFEPVWKIGPFNVCGRTFIQLLSEINMVYFYWRSISIDVPVYFDYNYLILNLLKTFRNLQALLFGNKCGQF